MAHVTSPDGRDDAWGDFRFAAQVRVDVSDTDLGGIVYYGRYAHFVDHGVIAYRRHLGIPPLGVDGHLFVVRALSVEYLSSARFDDVLDVRVRTCEVGRTSHRMEVAVTRDDPAGVAELARARVTLVGVGGYPGPTTVPGDGPAQETPAPRPTRLPEELARRLREFEGL